MLSTISSHVFNFIICIMSQTYSIQSNQLKVSINSLGGEIRSVKNAQQTEFMWQADAAIWPRTAPVLFPIVGKVLHNILHINQQKFKVTQHGFARDMEFELVHQTENELALKLGWCQHTLALYPYKFVLVLTYKINGNKLECGYGVINEDEGEMHFSIGAHPGFCLFDGLENYTVYVDTKSPLTRWLLADGLLDKPDTENYFANGNLPLSIDLFSKDALVFRQWTANQVLLKHNASKHAITMQTQGFTSFALWTKPGTQQFICLEPWFGHADMVHGHADIAEKPGMVNLKPEQTFEASYAITFEN